MANRDKLWSLTVQKYSLKNNQAHYSASAVVQNYTGGKYLERNQSLFYVALHHRSQNVAVKVTVK